MRIHQLKPTARPLDAVLTAALVIGLIVAGYALGFGFAGIFVAIVIIGEVVLREGRKHLRRQREAKDR
jgi:hypothetical protein